MNPTMAKRLPPRQKHRGTMGLVQGDYFRMNSRDCLRYAQHGSHTCKDCAAGIHIYDMYVDLCTLVISQPAKRKKAKAETAPFTRVMFANAACAYKSTSVLIVLR